MTDPDRKQNPQPHQLLRLRWLPGRYAILRFPREDDDLPDLARFGRGLVSITRTEDELSIIAPEGCVSSLDAHIDIETGWVAMQVVGPLSFDLVGILARLSGALAAAGVPLCAVSTFDTDVLLVKAQNRERASTALRDVAVFDKSSSAIPKEEQA